MPDNADLMQALRQRVKPLHLRQRLGIEEEHNARIFGMGRNFFHIENWYSIHAVMRNLLRLTLLYRRGQRNAAHIEVRHNTITLARLPEAFEGYTLLQLSDLHLEMREDIPHAIAAAVRELDFDCCLITGDFRARTYGPYDRVIAAMQRLRPHLGEQVYAVLGNHDTIRMVPELESMDINLLLNESTSIQKGSDKLFLAGIDDAHYYRAENLENAGQNIPEQAVAILLSHTPEIYRHAAHCGFDLMLSGHTHGGQICLPGGIPLMCNMRAPRHLCRGSWRYQNMQGYTSGGTGVSVLDVRLNCPAEVTLHHLHRGGEDQ